MRYIIFRKPAAPPLACATPTFSLAPGTYSGTQSNTLSCTTPSSNIYFTIDGSTPSVIAGVPQGTTTHYTTAISVAASETIKAIATATSFTQSALAQASYTINSTSYKFNPGDYMSSYQDEQSTATADWETEIGVLQSFGTNINGYRLTKSWSGLENFAATSNGAFAAAGLTGGALQAAINTQFTGFADVEACFYYLQALCPGKRLMLYINHHSRSSYSGSFIQTNNFVTNPQTVPAWIANGGVVDSGSAGTLKIPNSYGASATNLYSGPIDKFYASSSYYGFAFDGLSGSGSTATLQYGIPAFWVPPIRQAMAQVPQALFQRTLSAGSAYNAGTAYTPGMPLTYSGTNYLCIAPSTGNLPTNTAYFMVNPWAGKTFDDPAVPFEMSGSNMEYSFDFTTATNISGCLYQNPPHSSAGVAATRASLIAGYKALFKAWTAASPHTIVDTCFSFSGNVQSPFDTVVTMGQHTNSLITGGESDALNTITGLALGNSNHYALDFGPSSQYTATGPEQAYIGINVPTSRPTARPTPNALLSLVKVMVKVDQHQEEDYWEHMPSGVTLDTMAVIDALIVTDAALGAQYRIWSPKSSNPGPYYYTNAWWTDRVYPGIQSNATKANTTRPSRLP